MGAGACSIQRGCGTLCLRAVPCGSTRGVQADLLAREHFACSRSVPPYRREPAGRPHVKADVGPDHHSKTHPEPSFLGRERHCQTKGACRAREARDPVAAKGIERCECATSTPLTLSLSDACDYHVTASWAEGIAESRLTSSDL